MADTAELDRDMSELLPRKQPRQGRSKKTVEKVLRATRHILETEGHQGLTTHTVARVSGVTIGSIYQYFPSKHAIFYALFVDWLDDVVALVSKALSDENEDRPLEERLKNAVLAFVDHEEEDRFSREITAAMSDHPAADQVNQLHEKRIAALTAPLITELTGNTDPKLVECLAIAAHRSANTLIETVWDAPPEYRQQVRDWVETSVEASIRSFVKTASTRSS